MEQPTGTTEVEQPARSPEQNLVPVPWTKRDIFWAVVLGVLILLGLVMLMLLGLAVYQLLTGTESSPGPLVTLILVAELGLLLPVWALGVHKYRLPWSSVGFRRFDLARGLALGCLFLLAAFGFNLVWGVILGVFDLQVQPDMLPLFGGGIPGLLLALLAGGLVAPIAEEAFFRGYVFAGLRQHLGLLPAMLLSAALFALVHILPTSWPPIFVLGVLFALLYDQTGSIWPAVFVHGIINALAFLVSYLMPTV
jgi:membrane protease YdiL (CAAX protease family)